MGPGPPCPTQRVPQSDGVHTEGDAGGTGCGLRRANGARNAHRLCRTWPEVALTLRAQRRDWADKGGPGPSCPMLPWVQETGWVRPAQIRVEACVARAESDERCVERGAALGGRCPRGLRGALPAGRDQRCAPVNGLVDTRGDRLDVERIDHHGRVAAGLR